MFANSIYGIGPFASFEPRHGFSYHYHSPLHDPSFYQGNYGYHHPPFYQGHLYWEPFQYEVQAIQDQNMQHIGKKAKKKPNTHEYHMHHGYPYGQGSGMFPDYYNSTY
jgi:hypothetical protein